MMVGSVVSFMAYEIFFTVSLSSQLRYRAAATLLPLSYLNVTNVFPCLTGQMTNIWYPVAYLLKKPADPIYSVSDQILLLSHLSAKWSATIVVLAPVAFHVFRVERNAPTAMSDKFVGMLVVATLMVPFIMTWPPDTLL